MPILSNIFKFMFTPRLYGIYNSRTSYGEVYEPNSLEKWTDLVIITSMVLWNFAITYGCPFLVSFAYRRGYLTGDGPMHLFKLGNWIGAIAILHLVIRSLGRATNSTYVSFYNRYSSILNDYNSQSKKELQNYEFDFSSWPVDFNDDDELRYEKKNITESFITSFGKAFSGIQSFIGFIGLRVAGIKIMYPGSISVLNLLLMPTLQAGRKKLIEDKNGERFKLHTPDHNYLDVMFVDRRGQTSRGSVLVICTEGNAGFYEIGIMVSPLEIGYSVLGWNHPGFGFSTGTPFVYAEQYAIETIMQFAFQKLNFTPENIILFGWSIGGYVSSVAASNYPDIKGVVLDATFDDIVPLAKKQMPSLVKNVVEVTIKTHANLNIGENLVKFNGPIKLIRRSEDEIVSLKQGDLSSNCGNYLLLRILKFRYPALFVNESESALWDWLSTTGSKQDLIFERYGINKDVYKQEYRNFPERTYPLDVGEDWDINKKTQMLLFLASVYCKDFSSTHCTPLPSSYLESAIDF